MKSLNQQIEAQRETVKRLRFKVESAERTLVNLIELRDRRIFEPPARRTFRASRIFSV